MTGWLYRAAPEGEPAPTVVYLHGGPEGQSRPGYNDVARRLLDIGVTCFAPNVRGSTGFGKRFVALDNGPFKREDSVKDIGAFLDRFDKDPRIDSKRIAETGGSYGAGIEFTVFSGVLDGNLRLTADYMLYLDKTGAEFDARSVGVKLQF